MGHFCGKINETLPVLMAAMNITSLPRNLNESRPPRVGTSSQFPPGTGAWDRWAWSWAGPGPGGPIGCSTSCWSSSPPSWQVTQGAVSNMILSFVLSCLQARWWARALGSTPWISTPRLERESLWHISRSDILYTVTDNVKCYIWCVLVTEEGVRQDHLPGRVQRHGGQGAVAPGTLLLHNLHAVSSSC